MLVLHCPQLIGAVYEDILYLPPGHVSYILRASWMHSLVKFPDDVDDAQEKFTLNRNAR